MPHPKHPNPAKARPNRFGPAAPAPTQERRWPTAQLRAHSQAAIVPDPSSGDYAAFQADVSERGIVVPLDISKQGIVLDRHQRLRAGLVLEMADYEQEKAVALARSYQNLSTTRPERATLPAPATRCSPKHSRS